MPDPATPNTPSWCRLVPAADPQTLALEPRVCGNCQHYQPVPHALGCRCVSGGLVHGTLTPRTWFCADHRPQERAR